MSFNPSDKLRWVYTATTVLSAFLLFQIQPLIGKVILPWFGGGAGVWSVCLLFFQSLLLLGYLYAHLLTKLCKNSTQSTVHATVAFLSLFFLPVRASAAWRLGAPGNPSLGVLLALAVSVGLPFFVLSSTSPLLQAWYGQAGKQLKPYRLYASSNAASLLALLSYPAVFEPFTSGRHQRAAWSVGYGAFVVGVVFVAMSRRHVETSASNESSVGSESFWRKLLWIALAGCASMMLLSVTAYLSQNIAAVPFLWVMPLAIYLLTFVLCFAGGEWYRRGFYLRVLAAGLAAMAYLLGESQRVIPPSAIILIFCFGLFACCMVCHGELAARRPVPAGLTTFYLCTAFGGALGSLFVAIVAPHVFSGYYELPISLGCCGVLIRIVSRQQATDSSRWSTRRRQLIVSCLAAALCASLIVTARREAVRFRVSARNFYGVLRVEDVPGPPIVVLQGNTPHTFQGGPGYRELINGTIEHGLQFLAASRAREATTYYGPQSGVAFALQSARRRGPVKVGIIGLGSGTLATYGKPGDQFTFYEINPLVVEFAQRDFGFLRESQAETKIVQGDARLALEDEPGQHFDVLVVDAFSGDAIPTHLLTREAFQLYARLLRPNGLVAVHVSNRYLDVAPVVLAAARNLRSEARVIENQRDVSHAVYPATWVVIGKLGTADEKPSIALANSSLSGTESNLWTDDYSSVLKAFRW